MGNFSTPKLHLRAVILGQLILARMVTALSRVLVQYIMTLFPILGSTHLPTVSIADPTPLWKLVPALALSTLFISSTIFTESISAAKYPEYSGYQSRVGMFWPASTLLKGIWLSITGRKTEVDRMVWGPAKGKRTE